MSNKKGKLNTPEGRMQFAKESAENPEQPASTLAMTLFGGNPAANEGLEKLLAKAERRNMPQMIKPGDVPMDGIVTGKIIKIVDSPVTTVKGKLLWLQHEGGQEFTFPVTGVIRNALCPGVEEKELRAALEKEIGKTFIAKRLPGKISGKFKKEMFMFDVYTVKH